MAKAKIIRDSDNSPQSASRTGASIFDREYRRLGRPLHTIEKIRVIAKYLVIILLLSLGPFFVADYWEMRNLYAIPKEHIFTDVSFRIGGGGKSPPMIALTKEGKSIFFSPCEGLKESVCFQEEFIEKSTLANAITVVEVSPRRGVIKKIETADAQGQAIKISNPLANHYINNYPRNPYKKNWLFLVSLASCLAVYVVSRMIPIKQNSEGTTHG